MDTSSSPKRSRSNSPSALPDTFPFYEALKGHVGIFRHIFFDMMDAETRHICRAVSSSWMAGLPALEGPHVTHLLNKWAYKNGHAHFLALGPRPRKRIPLRRLYSAVERGHTDIVTLIHTVNKEDDARRGFSNESPLYYNHVWLKETAARNADLPMLKLLHQFNSSPSIGVLRLIQARYTSGPMEEWARHQWCTILNTLK